MRVKSKKLVYYGVGIAILFTIAYIITLIQIRNCNCDLTLNEFGDYIGGIFNPIFTLLSTIAIAVLTYFIAVRDDDKAKESLEIQKKVTLIQLRQNAYESFNSRLNNCHIQFAELGIKNYKAGSFLQKTHSASKEASSNRDKIYLDWATIVVSIADFEQQKHLFKELILDENFKLKLTELFEYSKELRSQGMNYHFYISDTVTKYLQTQQEINNLITEFIIKEF